jgi:2-polyprenyl-3-methyl-5-hydroxy-6-metoxy-1,4-benzoquinol methylase
VTKVTGLERIACPLCHGHHARPWGSENGYDAVKCLNCGLVYVNPRPELTGISEANKIGEHRTSEGQLNVVYRRSRRKVEHYRAIVRRLFADQLRDKPISWLDIGAGYGELIEALTGLLPAGSKIQGIEPMQEKAQQAQKLGLPISTAPLSSINTGHDVVSLINVFSHLPDFDAFLGDVRNAMKPGGTLFLETGNGGDLGDASQYPDRLYLPDHLVFAGVDHVKTYLERNGFSVMAIHSRRLDTVFWMAKNVIKRVLGRDAKISIPLSSPFRTVFFKARLSK